MDQNIEFSSQMFYSWFGDIEINALKEIYLKGSGCSEEQDLLVGSIDEEHSPTQDAEDVPPKEHYSACSQFRKERDLSATGFQDTIETSLLNERSPHYREFQYVRNDRARLSGYDVLPAVTLPHNETNPYSSGACFSVGSNMPRLTGYDAQGHVRPNPESSARDLDQPSCSGSSSKKKGRKGQGSKSQSKKGSNNSKIKTQDDTMHESFLEEILDLLGNMRLDVPSDDLIAAGSHSDAVYIPLRDILPRVRAPRNRDRGYKNWEFLMHLLVDPRTNPTLIKWVDKEQGIFRLCKPKIIAQIWALRNGKTSEISYDNFARGLRYNYHKGNLAAFRQRQLMYKCGPNALQFLEELQRNLF